MGNVSASSTMKEKIVNDVLGDIMTILSVNCLVIWPSMPLFHINKQNTKPEFKCDILIDFQTSSNVGHLLIVKIRTIMIQRNKVKG